MASATGDPSIGTAAFTVYLFSNGSIRITVTTLYWLLGWGERPFKREKACLRLSKTTRDHTVHVFVTGQYQDSHPQFASQSPAACVDLAEALPADVQDIRHSVDDDAVLEKWTREHVGTTWHSLGTCKMQAREKKGVVDADLGMCGVNGLEIADLSIAPGIITANTNATTIMMKEKAGNIFIKQLRRGSV